MTQAQNSPEKPVLRLLQLSDFHVTQPGRRAYGVVDGAGALDRALGSLERLIGSGALGGKVDALLLSGDLTDAGLPEEYAEVFSRLERLGLPSVVIAGNHDDAAELRRHRPRGPEGRVEESPCGRHQYFEIDRLGLVALDSTVPGQGGGRLDGESLNWLDDCLARRDGQPTVVMVHHPPIAVRIPHMDALMLENGAELGRIIASHRNVKAVLCGHIHRAVQRIWAGTHLAVAPGIAHAVTYDERQRPGSFIMEPPAFYLHLLDKDNAWTTQWMAIGNFDGPYPFRPET